MPSIYDARLALVSSLNPGDRVTIAGGYAGGYGPRTSYSWRPARVTRVTESSVFLVVEDAPEGWGLRSDIATGREFRFVREGRAAGEEFGRSGRDTRYSAGERFHLYPHGGTEEREARLRHTVNGLIDRFTAAVGKVECVERTHETLARITTAVEAVESIVATKPPEEPKP